MQAMVYTRPDIAHDISMVSRYMANLGKIHWETVKTILRYLNGTPDYELIFGIPNSSSLVGYCDSDYEGDKDKRKSTSGYMFIVGGKAISWRASLQSIVALSTIEVELIAAIEVAKEELYLK